MIEPDFLPVTIAEPAAVGAVGAGLTRLVTNQGIDYHIGRALAPTLAARGLKRISGKAEAAIYNGDSLWPEY